MIKLNNGLIFLFHRPSTKEEVLQAMFNRYVISKIPVPFLAGEKKMHLLFEKKIRKKIDFFKNPEEYFLLRVANKHLFKMFSKLNKEFHLNIIKKRFFSHFNVKEFLRLSNFALSEKIDLVNFYPLILTEYVFNIEGEFFIDLVISDKEETIIISDKKKKIDIKTFYGIHNHFRKNEFNNNQYIKIWK